MKGTKRKNYQFSVLKVFGEMNPEELWQTTLKSRKQNHAQRSSTQKAQKINPKKIKK